MITRQYITCETCDQAHTLRIGLGHNKNQSHTFSCRACKEDITVNLELDFENHSWSFVPGSNACSGESEGLIVNLDPDYPIDGDDISRDGHFARLKQGAHLISEKIKRVDKKFGEGAFEALMEKGGPDYSGVYDEWEMLRKAWSLHNNAQKKLVQARVAQASKQLYAEEPLDGFYAWQWRFCGRLGSSRAKDVVDGIFEEIKDKGLNKDEFSSFLKYFRDNLFSKHQGLYFDILKQRFNIDPALSQVHVYSAMGVDLPISHEVTSYHFDDVKMFYGNAFEVFTVAVETLACLNNLLSKRSYDQFERMNLAQYLKIDKSGRCKCFQDNKALHGLVFSLDNHIRNASHHGGMTFDLEQKKIFYRAGKGGQGSVKEISYTDYLIMCEDMMLSITALMQVELILKQHF